MPVRADWTDGPNLAAVAIEQHQPRRGQTFRLTIDEDSTLGGVKRGIAAGMIFHAAGENLQLAAQLLGAIVEALREQRTVLDSQHVAVGVYGARVVRHQPFGFARVQAAEEHAAVIRLPAAHDEQEALAVWQELRPMMRVLAPWSDRRSSRGTTPCHPARRDRCRRRRQREGRRPCSSHLPWARARQRASPVALHLRAKFFSASPSRRQPESGHRATRTDSPWRSFRQPANPRSNQSAAPTSAPRLRRRSRKRSSRPSGDRRGQLPVFSGSGTSKRTASLSGAGAEPSHAGSRPQPGASSTSRAAVAAKGNHVTQIGRCAVGSVSPGAAGPEPERQRAHPAFRRAHARVLLLSESDRADRAQRRARQSARRLPGAPGAGRATASRAVRVRLFQFCERSALDRTPTRQQIEKEHAKAVDVTRNAGRASFEKLRRHVEQACLKSPSLSRPPPTSTRR